VADNAIRRGFLLLRIALVDAIQPLLQFRDLSFQFGDPAILLPVLLPPAVPDLLLELNGALEDPAVLGLHSRTLFPYAPILHTAPV